MVSEMEAVIVEIGKVKAGEVTFFIAADVDDVDIYG